jgi:ABC-type nickel/cobalt efflux system permease component RcnA
MITSSQIYWLLMLDNIRSFLVLLSIVLGLGTLIGIVVAVVCADYAKSFAFYEKEKNEIEYKLAIKWLIISLKMIPIVLFVVLLAHLTPSKWQ